MDRSPPPAGDNDISDLQGLIDARILEGGTLDLTDNPLGSLAYHVQIDVLRGHITNVAYNDMLGHETDGLRTLVVGVKQGLGTIAINTVPAGGVEAHTLTNYENETYDLWLAEYPAETGTFDAPSNPVSITATPADGDGHLDYWMGSYFAYGPRDAAALSVILFNDTKLNAVIEGRPGIGTLDLVSDFEDFVAEVLPAEDWETLDENGVSYDENLTPLFSGNGIPDVVEVSLLDAVLKDAEIDFASRSGVVNYFTWKAWETNLVQAQNQLASVVPGLGGKAYLKRIVAAYMTFGDDATIQWLSAVIADYVAQDVLDPGMYDRSEQRYFDREGDADNDGAWNVDEWKGLSQTGTIAADIVAYTEAALDPAVQPSSFKAGGDTTKEAGGECAAAGCVGYVPIHVYDPNTPPFMNADLWLPSANTLTVTRSDTGETIAPGQTASVPVGTEISVEAQEDGAQRYKFSQWMGTGTLIDGSRNKKERFYATWATTIVAGFGRNEVVVPASTPTVTYSVGGALNAGAHPRYPGLVRYFLRPDQIATLSGKSTSYSRAAWVIQPGVGAAAPAHNRTNPTMVSSAPYAYINSIDLKEKQASVALLGSRGGYILGSANPYNRGAAWGSVVSGMNSLIRVDATPYAGYNWVGYASKGPYYTGPTTDWGVEYLVAGKNPYARAVFDKKNEHSMTLKVTGDDAPCSGYVMVEPAMKYYPHGTSVSLEAFPVPGYVFMGWGVGGTGPVTRTGNTATVTMNSDRAVTAVFSWNDIEIKSADLCLDKIEIDLVGAAGVLVEYMGPDVDTHVIFSGGLPAGTSKISFNPASIPVGEFTTLRATIAGATEECETDSDTFDYHIQNLGGYRHSQYNTPDESIASCDNGTTTDVCLVDASCNYTSGVPLSNPFAYSANLNGSGLSLSHGFLSKEAWCIDPDRQVQHPIPSACSGYIFRPTARPGVTCGGGQPVPGETVARHPGNQDLHCGDRVFIPGVGCKVVSDEGGGLRLNQLDHYTVNPGCGSAIADLVPDPTNTFKIFD